MKYVYILESIDTEHFYVGIADDVLADSTSITRVRCPIPRSIGLGV
jgi:hypothetical protein